MCAANVSEGRDLGVLDALRDAAGGQLLDVHVDADHHRCVLTMAGGIDDLVARVDDLAIVALATIDLRRHAGVHPRLGALDVVPFAPLAGSDLSACVAAREAAIEVLRAHGIPVFRFGEGTGERSLPEVRRGAFGALEPDAGPPRPHESAGATAVGARRPLVAWNAWVQGATLEATRAIASAVRSPEVRALGFAVPGATHVSCNLLDPVAVTPLDVYRRIEVLLEPEAHVVRCELVGLVPDAVLASVPEAWWQRLDLDEERSTERRAASIGVVA